MKIPSRIWLLIAAAGLLLVGAALSSCSQDKSAPVLEATITPVAMAPADAPGPEDDVLAGDGLMPVAFTDTACLDCHSNIERVQALAIEEEESSLSSGPG